MKPYKIELHRIPGTNVYWEAMPPTLAELGREFIESISLQLAETIPSEDYMAWPYETEMRRLISCKVQYRTVIVLLIRDRQNGNKLVLSWDFDYSPKDGQNRLIPSMN